MEPFDSQDPLTKLLAQARRIEARSNFTQNVLRTARQTPQDRGWRAAVRAWWAESSAPAGKWVFATGMAAAAALAVAVAQLQPERTQPASQLAHQQAPAMVPPAGADAAPEASLAEAGMPDLPAAESAWEAAYQTEALLAVDDTTQFTDSEISFLLY